MTWRKPRPCTSAVSFSDGTKKKWKKIQSYTDGSGKEWNLDHEIYRVEKYHGRMPIDPFRIMLTKNEHILASNENLNNLLQDCWIYLVEKLPALIPPNIIEEDRILWIVAHITEVRSAEKDTLKKKTELSRSDEQLKFIEIEENDSIDATDVSASLGSSDDEIDVSAVERKFYSTGDMPPLRHSFDGSEIKEKEKEKLKEQRLSFGPRENIVFSVPEKERLSKSDKHGEKTKDSTSSAERSSGKTEAKIKAILEDPDHPNCHNKKNILDTVKKMWKTGSSDHVTPVTHIQGEKITIEASTEEEAEEAFSVSVMLFLRAIFHEDATREQRTHKYYVLATSITILYSFIVRYCSFDLFLVVLGCVIGAFCYIIKERKKYIVALAKRKMKKMMAQKKKSWFPWQQKGSPSTSSPKTHSSTPIGTPKVHANLGGASPKLFEVPKAKKTEEKKDD